MWRRSPRALAALVVGTIVATLMVGESRLPAVAQTTLVTATVETDPVPSGGDADDPAIWVHPRDPSLSTVIGSDKENGLGVYDLSGRQIQFVSGIQPNNVDIRHDFPLGGQQIDLVVSSDRENDSIAFHRVDPQTRQLVSLGSPLATGMDIYGVCLYLSPLDGAHYVFVTSEEAGPVGQFQLTDDGSGGVSGREVRQFQMGSTSEGCVADNGFGYLYVAEEDVGIWKYDAEPDGGSNRVSVDEVGPNLEDDVEGVTIYYGSGGAGYLIVSSQGSSDYAVYRRDGNNDFLSKFEIVDSAGIDSTSGTDGIDVISTPLGSAFPTGVFVAHDSDNEPEENNFKLVPWDLVAGSANPPLAIETRWDPRGENNLNLPRPSLPQTSAIEGVAWNVAGATIADAADDDGGASNSGDVLVMQQGSRVLLRFSDLEIPDGSVLRRAHVGFTAAEGGDENVVLTITGVLDGGTETTSVTWAPASWNEGESGPYQQTPELSQVIKEMIAGGWEPGDAITLAVTATGAGARSAVAFDAAPEAAPGLTLEYTQEG
jgi:myo-inositol-hexaphosphate 3-phosphohydrolase